MRTLLIDSDPATSAQVAVSLGALGHEVVRCRERGAPAFPCAALAPEGCPLERGPVDVVVTAHDSSWSIPGADEAGVTCALRIGVPVVAVSATGHPFGDHAEPCTDPADVGSACDRAIDAAGRRRAAPLEAEARRLLTLEGVDAGHVAVEVVRDAETARIVVRTERPVAEGPAGRVATRLHALDATGSWPTTKVSVAVVSSAAPAAPAAPIG